MLRSAILLLALTALLAACNGDEHPFDESPYAAAIPQCPPGLKTSGELAGPEKTIGVIESAFRGCGEKDEQRWYGIRKFDSVEAAHNHLVRLKELYLDSESTDEWRPSSPVDEFQRLADRTSIEDCEQAEQRGPDYGACFVRDDVMARIGSVVLRVTATAEAEISVPPKGFSCGTRPSRPDHELLWEQCVALLFPHVVGDAHWTDNQQDLDSMLQKFRSLPKSPPD